MNTRLLISSITLVAYISFMTGAALYGADHWIVSVMIFLMLGLAAALGFDIGREWDGNREFEQLEKYYDQQEKEQ